MTVNTPTAFDEWCVVELRGYRRHAARVREVTIAGAGMLRLDEPATEQTPARTQYVSPSAVYALHPVTEDVVQALAAQWHTEPVFHYELPRAPEPSSPDEDDEPAF